MNHVKLAHYGKAASYTLGGKGRVYINGHKVDGVLAFEPRLLDTDEVASVTITLAVSTFTFEPDEQE
jgi:hypothetical protein